MSDVLTDLLQQDATRLVVHARSGVYNDPTFDASYDLTQAVKAVTLTESYREAAMRCEVEVDPGVGIDTWPVHIGSLLVIYGRTFFGETSSLSPVKTLHMGLIFQDDRSASADDMTRTYTSYDPLTYLARNEFAQVFKNNTLTEIINTLAAQMGVPTILGFVGIPVNNIITTNVPLGQIVQGPSMTCWDVIQEARQRHYRKTGEIVFIRFNHTGGGSLEVNFMGNTGVVWRITPSTTALSGNYQESAEEMRTQVQVVAEEYDTDDNGNQTIRQRVVAERSLPADNALVRRFGYLRTIVPPDNTEGSSGEPTQAEVDNQADWAMATMGRTTKRLTLTSMMLPGMRRGDSVLVEVPNVVTPQIFYVETIVTEYREGVMEQRIDLVQEGADVEVTV